MKRKFKRALAVLLAVLVAVPNVSGLTISNVYAATYRNGKQSGPSTSYKNGKYYKNYQKVPITGDNRTDLLAIALSQLGYQEGASDGKFSGEVSGSSNYVEFSYNMGDLGIGYGGSDYPWCASFVSWCLYQSRCTDHATYKELARYHKGDYNYIWKEISCSQWVTQLTGAGYFKKSKYRGGSYTPKSGDLVFFSWDGSGADHIGLCLYTDGSKIYTVEGNTSDAEGLEDNGGGVYFKSYSLSYSCLFGYGAMPYKENTAVPDIDYSGAKPTPGLYIAAKSNKYVYKTETATSYTYLLPRFSIFEVDEICDNGRLGGTFTINGETVKGYVMNNTDRVIQLSSTDTTADERATLKTLIAKAESARHYQYSEAAIMELRTAYANAVKSYNDSSVKESALQDRVKALEKALVNTGTNDIALNNKGIYVNGINKKITTGDCIVFTNKHGGDGLISVSNANIAYTVNVVVKWNTELGMNVVKSVNVANGVDTASIQLESDEYLIAAHGWENISGSDVSVEYSGTNFSLLSNLKVGTGVIASGINLDDTTGVAPCSFIKFVPADAVRMNSRNEIVEAGDFTLFTPEFDSGKLTAANANIHKTLNVIAKWDVEKEGWYVADKYVGTGAEDAMITITDGTVVIAGLIKEDDGISKVSYEKLNAAKVGDKIIFSGISPNTGSGVSVAANVSFETVASEEETPGEETTTKKPVEDTSTEESTTEKTTTEKETTTKKPVEETSTKDTSTEKDTTEKPEESSDQKTEEETTEKVQDEEESSSKEDNSDEEESSSEEESSKEEESSDEEESTEANVDAQKPVIVQKPISAEYFCKDTAVALKVHAKSEDDGVLSYQWYRNKKKSTSGATKISGATDMTYVPTTDVAGSYYYYCIITNTNTEATGKKTAVINSGYAKVQVRKLANKITGVNSSWKKSVDADVFKLPATAKGKITFKSSNENVAIVSSTGSVAVKKIGTAYITITAGDALYQTVTKKVKIQVVPATVKMNYIASDAKKALSVKWDKVSDISGFKIQYSTTKDFKVLKTSYVGSLRHSKTRSDLIAGQRYYVRVCAYKKIGKTTYQGAYSDYKTFVVKK